MEQDEWIDWYKESLKEWKNAYRNAMNEWKERFKDWKVQAKTSISEGITPHFPQMPPIPSIMPRYGKRSNVVASRISNRELELIDLLIEAGLFNTRSEAVAYLVSEGIKGKKDVFKKVTSALEDIRRIREEAEEQVTSLKKEIGITENNKTND